MRVFRAATRAAELTVVRRHTLGAPDPRGNPPVLRLVQREIQVFYGAALLPHTRSEGIIQPESTALPSPGRNRSLEISAFRIVRSPPPAPLPRGCNRAPLIHALQRIPSGSHVLLAIDAHSSGLSRDRSCAARVFSTAPGSKQRINPGQPAAHTHASPRVDHVTERFHAVRPNLSSVWASGRRGSR